MISHKHKFIFIHIPKTAGTSLELSIEDSSCVYKRGEWDVKSTGFNLPTNHFSLNQISRSGKLSPTELSSFFKFSFVRNPWDKVISECFCGQIQLVFKNCKTIKEKIKTVCELSSTGYAGHFVKQIDFIQDKNYKIDFLGRFENLENDYSSLCAKLNINKKKLPHKHKSNRKNYKEYFDQETIDLVASTYREDIELFNYSY